VTTQALGSEHPQVAGCLRGLAKLTYTLGKDAEAGELCQQALTLSTQALGPEHPDVATSLNDLAEMWRAQGKYAKALEYHQASR